MLADVCSLSYIIRIDLSFAVWPRLSRSKTGQEGQVLLPGYFHIQETWHLFNSCRDEMHSRTASFVGNGYPKTFLKSVRKKRVLM